MGKWLLAFMLFTASCAAQSMVDTVRLGTKEETRASRFFIEAGASTMPLQLGRGNFMRIRMGMLPDKGSYMFFSYTWMTNRLREEYTYTIAGDPTFKVHPGERIIDGMSYLGFHYGYIFSASLVSTYMGIGFIVGDYGYDSTCPNLGPCQAGTMIGLEPEIGLRIQPLRFLELRAGLGTLLAVAFSFDGHHPEASFSVGLRALF